MRMDTGEFRNMVEEVLQSAGVSEAWIDTLLQDPFVDPENHLTAQETAQELLLAQVQDDGLSVFNPPRREIYERILEDLTGTKHYSTQDALSSVIEYATGSFHPVSTSTSFPHMSATLDVPFKLESDGIVRFNVTKSFVSNAMVSAIARAAGTDEKFAFHATSWAFADDIARNGIRLELCQHSRDLGRNRSFYLYTDCKDAMNFSHKQRTLYHRQNAILVFQLGQELAERNGCSWKILDVGSDEWRTVVTDSRNGKRSSIDQFDFVQSATSGCAAQSKLLRTVQRTSDVNLPSDQHIQIACKSERGVRLLESNLVGVIYLPQYDDVQTAVRAPLGARK